ncbi:MAG: class I SAM-dependent methyltransferase [Lentisphaerae bacterium]|nr:class I SAM-dependent methyltransferase [Lentisphaerota bacterium]
MVNRTHTMQLCQCDLTASAGRDAAVAAILDGHNRRWGARLDGFRAYAGAPWWSPGLIVTPELRGRYECWLPVAEFCADLARLGRAFLPAPSWVPRRLRSGAGEPSAGSSAAPLSLPDLWARLPTCLAARVAFGEADLPALFAALADPPRFGTDSARYEAQRAALAALCRGAAGRGRRLTLVDLACGVGLGTYEAAVTAAAAIGAPPRVLGLTLEPLEAWMASRCCLPHDPGREPRLRRLAAQAPPVDFLAADVRHLPLALANAVDVILCNGLVGGDHLRRQDDLAAVLREARRLLVPGGALLVANRFHDGCRAAVERFADLARSAGWHVDGTWHDLRLTP